MTLSRFTVLFPLYYITREFSLRRGFLAEMFIRSNLLSCHTWWKFSKSGENCLCSFFRDGIVVNSQVYNLIADSGEFLSTNKVFDAQLCLLVVNYTNNLFEIT